MRNDLALLTRAVRTSARRPLWSGLTMALVALCIGPLVVFGLVSRELTRAPLPYPDFDRLVQFATASASEAATYEIPGTQLLALQEHLTLTDAVAGWRLLRMTHEPPGEPYPQRVQAAECTAGLLELLAGAPFRGRFFTSDDELAGTGTSVVVSWERWQRQGSPQELDAARFVLDGVAYTPVGVLPRGFSLAGHHLDFYLPVSPAPRFRNELVDGVLRPVVTILHLQVIGRTRPGVTVTQLNEELAAVAAARGRRDAIIAEPLRERLTGDDQRLAAVALAGFLLFAAIAAATMAHLFLVRATESGRRSAICRTLGATSRHLRREAAAEGLVLGCGGAIGAVLLAQVLQAHLSTRVSSAAILGLSGSLEWTYAVVVTVAAVGCSVAFSLFTLRGHVESSGHLAPAGGHHAPNKRAQMRVMLASQAAVAGTLLAVLMGLLTGVRTLLAADVGFDPAVVFTLRLPLPEGKREGVPSERFFEPLINALRQSRAIDAVAISDSLPVLAGEFTMDVRLQSNDGTRVAPARLRVVSADYPAALGFMPEVSAVGWPGPERTVMVNREFARRYLATESPATARLMFHLKEWRIGAILPDTRNPFAPDGPVPEVFILTRDAESLHRPVSTQWASEAVLLVRSASPPHVLAPLIQDRLAALDPGVPPVDMATMREHLARQAGRTIGLAWYFGALGLGGFVLALSGVVGVTLLAVRARVREIGVRIALGLRPGRAAVALILEGVGAGACGAVAALPMSSAIMALVRHYDPYAPVMTPALWVVPAALLLAGVTLAAVPAARLASSVDPAQALRDE